MQPPPAVDAVPALADRVRAAVPLLGRTRLVCVDGPAGSGKTTLADRLVTALGPGAAVVHMDDLYAGWTLAGASTQIRSVVLSSTDRGLLPHPSTTSTGGGGTGVASAEKRPAAQS